MNSLQATVAYPIRSVVGEGCVWDADHQKLLWVDILDHKIYIFNPANGANTGFDLGQDVGAVTLTESGVWAFVDEGGLGFLNPDTGAISHGTKPAKSNPHIRFNDGKCDPRGTFWAGTMAYDNTKGAGTLYEFESNTNVKEKINNVTISNGMAWSKDNSRFYYVDSLTYEIQEYDYDIKTGDIRFRKIVANISQSSGLPDGMTIDDDDHLWVALFDGGRVIRINPETGETVFEVVLPAPKVTCCTFGGEHLNELYITTASYLMDEKTLYKYPFSGSLFKVEVPFTGRIPNRMKW